MLRYSIVVVSVSSLVDNLFNLFRRSPQQSSFRSKHFSFLFKALDSFEGVA